jgi:hypothetical protein
MVTYIWCCNKFSGQPRADVLAACWASGLILGTWWIARRLRRVSPQFTQILNLASAAALLMTLYSPAIYWAKGLSSRAVAEAAEAGQPAAMPVEAAQTPDIYYINPGWLWPGRCAEEIYGFDNHALVDYLKESGFYVAEESHSNYMRTILSIPSSLNSQYIDQMITSTPAADNYEPMKELLEKNAAAQFLRKRGYRFVMIRVVSMILTSRAPTSSSLLHILVRCRSSRPHFFPGQQRCSTWTVCFPPSAAR